VRQYARDRLVEDGEAAATHQRHAAYFLTLAEQTYAALRGSRQLAWLSRLELELDNLRAAMRWALEVGDVELELRLAAGIDRFWQYHSHIVEGQRWLELGLTASPIASEPVRAKALGLNGWLVRFLRGPVVAEPILRESLALYEALGDQLGIADVTDSLGDVAYFTGDLARALALHQENLARRRALGDHWGVTMTLNSLSWIVLARGEAVKAEALVEESLALIRSLGDQRGIALVLHGLALLARANANFPRAAALSAEALGLFRDVDSKVDIALNLAVLAAAAGAGDQPERAARLFGGASALLDAVGTKEATGLHFDFKRDIDDVQRALGAVDFARAWEEGRRLEVAEAVAYALGKQSN
jgi:non-specific serine/threonine protein kinase